MEGFLPLAPRTIAQFSDSSLTNPPFTQRIKPCVCVWGRGCFYLPRIIPPLHTSCYFFEFFALFIFLHEKTELKKTTFCSTTRLVGRRKMDYLFCVIFFLSLFTEGYGSCAQGFGSGRICLVLTGPTWEPSTVLYTELDPTSTFLNLYNRNF